MLIWNTFCECIKNCTHLVMAQCLHPWLLVCFLHEQDWLWNNSTSTALLQGADRRHFLASVHVALIHFLGVHQELHTPCHGPPFTSLTTCLLLAGTRLFWNSVLKLWIHVHVDTLFVSASRFAHLVMVQCLNFWLLLCFLQEQHWLWNNSTSTAQLQGPDRRHFIASVHVDWYTFCECIEICTHLVMAQCLHFWLLVCFLQEQDCFEIVCWSFEYMFMLIHFLWVHQDLHTLSWSSVYTFDSFFASCRNSTG